MTIASVVCGKPGTLHEQPAQAVGDQREEQV
jgi:hypothetical protein